MFSNIMEKEKPKLNVRKKKKTEVKSKATKERKTKIARGSRRNITIDDGEVQHLLIGRPKIFKSPEELIKFFNTYILTCLEKVRKYEIVPVKTVDVKEKSLKLDIMENDELTAEEELTEGKAWEKEAGKQAITNKLESKYEIKEKIQRKTTPSIGWFLTFLGGMSYTTRERYAKQEAFSGTVEQINNYLESVLIERAGEGKYNSQIAQFILNVNYGRVPKSKSEQVIRGNIVNEEDFIQD